MRLEGKVAVVTGGGAGIGEGIVMCMAREGADIAIPDIQEGNAAAVAKKVLAAASRIGKPVVVNFIGADPAQIEAAAQAGAPCVELHTGPLAHAWWDGDQAGMQRELTRIQEGLRFARSLGLRTHAGHGLALSQSEPGQADHVSSTALVAALPDVAELHIGHALIGHAVFVGLRQAIADFKAEAIRARRASVA